MRQSLLLPPSGPDGYAVRQARRTGHGPRCRTRAAGPDTPRRRYNNGFRLAARMGPQRERLALEVEKPDLTLIRKSRLASKRTQEEFSRGGDAISAQFRRTLNLCRSPRIGMSDPRGAGSRMGNRTRRTYR
jgi:hypothetical protein